MDFLFPRQIWNRADGLMPPCRNFGVFNICARPRTVQGGQRMNGELLQCLPPPQEDHRNSAASVLISAPPASFSGGGISVRRAGRPPGCTAC